MKRTLSSSLAPTPSPTNAPPDELVDLNPNDPREEEAANDGAPRMRAQNLNDTADENPHLWPTFDVDAELPDWEEFAQMLPRTPPVENQRDAQDDDASAASENDPSFDDASSEGADLSAFDEEIATKIHDGIAAGHDLVTIRNFGTREVREIIEACKQSPQIRALQLRQAGYFSAPPRQAIMKMVAEFFIHYDSVHTFQLQVDSFNQTQITSDLLFALFQNKGLTRLTLEKLSWTNESAEESQSLIDSIRKNTILKTLEFRNNAGNRLIQLILEALAGNSALIELDICDMFYEREAELLALLIQHNRQMKSLKLGGCFYGWISTAKEGLDDRVNERMREELGVMTDNSVLLALVFAEIEHNNTLQALHAGEVTCLRLMEKSLITPMLGNKSLKELWLPQMFDMTADAVEALIKLVRVHPALTMICFGSLPQDPQLRMALARALGAAPRLTCIGINFGNFFSAGTSIEDDRIQLSGFLNEIGKCPNLRTLSLKHWWDFDYLSDFVESHPGIREIELPDYSAIAEEAQEKLLSLVRKSSQITRLFSASNAYSPDKGESGFRKELAQALWINQQIELNLQRAGEAMKALLDKKSLTDEALPFAPLDVTNELAKAIARHVPPEKAKAIFDELILQAPKASQ